MGVQTRNSLLNQAEELRSEVQRVRERLDLLFEELGQTIVSWMGGQDMDIWEDESPSSFAKAAQNGTSGVHPSIPPVAGLRAGSPEGINGTESRNGPEKIQGDFSGEVRWRIPAIRREEPQWSGVQDRVEEMISLVGGILIPLRKVNGKLRDRVEEGLDDLEHVWADLSAVFSRLDSARAFLKRVLEGEEGQEVFWAEVRVRGGRRQVSLHLTPLNAAPILHRTLYSQVPPIVMTSATLAVADSFDFFDSRLGIGELEDRDVIHRIYPSSFNLSEQMRLAVLDALPDPGKPGFVEALSRAVMDSVLTSGGGALILFTSYRTLTRVFELCRDSLLNAGISSMRQGEAPRTVLLESFRADPDSVLFATDSFWEGVDVVGSSLRLVILARLPFPVPTDPVNEARSEVLLGEGRDPFMEDSVPRAVIRMRQGIGRLIRHKEDSGYVVICDGRIVRRSYGRMFMQSLGDVPVRRMGVAELVRDMEDFLNR